MNNSYDQPFSKRKDPNEGGHKILMEMQLGMFRYLEACRRTPEPQQALYCPTQSFRNGLGASASFAKLERVHSMMIFGEKNASHCMTFMQNDKQIAVGTSKGTLMLLHLSNYLNSEQDDQVSWRSMLRSHDQTINSLRLNRTGNFLLFGDKNGAVKFLKVGINTAEQETAKMYETDPRRHREPVRDLCFSPTDEKVATCSDDKTIRIIDFTSGIVDSVLEGHGSDITTVDWHNSYAFIASGGKDRFIKTWDARNGKEICSLYKHTNSISKLRFSPDGNYLLSGGRDQMVKVFDVRTMKHLHDFKAHGADVLALQWNPVLPHIFASSDQSGNICVWDTTVPKAPLATLSHTASEVCEIWELSWNQMGTMLASCGSDKFVRIWTSRDFMGNPRSRN